MSDMFKVNNKDTKTMPGDAAVSFEHISHFIITIAEFEQINASSTWETVISDNEVVFRTVRNTLPYGLGKPYNLRNDPEPEPQRWRNQTVHFGKHTTCDVT